MSGPGERTLWQAARPAAVVHYLGQLAIVLGLVTLVPTAAAIVLGDYQLVPSYLFVVAALLGLGAASRLTSAPRALQRHEALVITALTFVLSPLFLSLPLAAQGLAFADALFEAVSGVTTTGLSTLGSLAERTPTFLFARAWMQWIGGLGFVVLSLALMPAPAAAARQLGSSVLDTTDMVASVRAHARLVLRIYLALTAVGIVVLLALGATPFDAVVHTLAGISTGGFAPRDDSLASLGPALATAVLLLAACGAIALPRYAALARGRWREWRDDVELRALLAAIALASVLLVLLEAGARPVGELVLLALSAQTTAGFATFDPALLGDEAKAALVVSMLTGGAQGSTAGGIKLLRLLLVVRLVCWLVAQTRLPNRAVSAPTLAGAPLGADELLRAAAVIVLFGAVVVLSWFAFLLYGYAPLDALFEVASATGTVGLSVGLTRPELEPLLKGVLCVDMLLGRLEVFALLVALSPRTWLGRPG